MKRFSLQTIAFPIALCSALCGPAALSQQPIKLEGAAHLMAREMDDDGNMRTTLVKPDVVVPGDRVLFTTSYENTSSEAVTNFVVTNPLPQSIQLANDAALDLTVSVDGGLTWGRLRDLTVPQSEGKTRAARPSDVTHLRWIIPQIAPNETGSVEYIGAVR